MRRRLVAALSVSIMLVAGCTDMQAGDGADDLNRQAAESAPASEPGRPSVSPSPSASATPSEAASDASEPASKGSEQPSESTSEAQAGAADDAAGDDTVAAVGRNAPRSAVKKLQRRLADLGFAPGPVDGAYGPRTTAAVEAFQMLAGLKQSGKADAETVTALADYRYDGPVAKAGDKGRDVKELQKRLASGPFDPGPADGEYGTKTVETVWALEKLAGVPVDGNWGPLDEHALELLQHGAVGEPEKKHKKRWVEVDLSQQLMKVYDRGDQTPVLVSHVSTGNGVAWSNEGHSGNSVTPQGDFVISRRIDGWRESSLDIGRLYNPLYFNGGIALHGAMSVPLYPASHGCVRVPMHIAEYLPDELPNGTPVHVLP